MMRRRDAPMKLIKRDEPPYEIKGRVTPVNGSNLVEPPMIRID
jgi:hypothetical protein